MQKIVIFFTLSFSLLMSTLGYAVPTLDNKTFKINDQQAKFFNHLLPSIQQNNQRILTERKQLGRVYQAVKKHQHLNATQIHLVKQLATSYRLPHFEIKRMSDWQDLFSRVDIIPPSMVLAQAANESAWGRSRFAKLGNNYFGQWCYTLGCGIVPLKRTAGMHHEVQRFSDPMGSIKSYTHNLNTHPTYRLFRSLRAKDRLKKQILKGGSLAEGLVNYSERRHSYVKAIQSMIRIHQLEKLDS